MVLKRLFLPRFVAFFTLALLCTAAGARAEATTDAALEEILLRLEVEEGQGEAQETVSISAPLDLLDTVWECLPQECREQLETSGIRREDILRDLAKMQPKELVRVEEKDEKVRIWLEPVTEKTREALNVLKVHVVNAKEEVNICLPRGVVQLGLVLSRALGLWEKGLPPGLALTGCQQHVRK